MSATQQLLRFGVFELNLGTQELRRSGTPIKLPPQPFRLLALLASHAGQIVSREEIQQQIWGQETYVDFEHGMNKCIKQIRTVLGDDVDRPLYIETLPRYGYRFIAPVVSQTVSVPRLKVVESDSGENPRDPVLVAGASGALAADIRVATPSRSPALEPDFAPIGPAPSRVWQVRVLWIGVTAVVLAAIIGGGLYWRTQRRSLTPFGNKEWWVGNKQRYEAGADLHLIYNGHPSACLRSKDSVTDGGYGTLSQSLAADKYRGKRVRYSAFVKSKDVNDDWAGLWMRVDGKLGPKAALAFDNMQNRPIKGTTPWQNYAVVLDVPLAATGISFGILLAGSGAVWINGIRFEVVGSDIPTTELPSDNPYEPKLGFED